MNDEIALEVLAVVEVVAPMTAVANASRRERLLNMMSSEKGTIRSTIWNTVQWQKSDMTTNLHERNGTCQPFTIPWDKPRPATNFCGMRTVALAVLPMRRP